MYILTQYIVNILLKFKVVNKKVAWEGEEHRLVGDDSNSYYNLDGRFGSFGLNNDNEYWRGFKWLSLKFLNV